MGLIFATENVFEGSAGSKCGGNTGLFESFPHLVGNFRNVVQTSKQFFLFVADVGVTEGELIKEVFCLSFGCGLVTFLFVCQFCFLGGGFLRWRCVVVCYVFQLITIMSVVFVQVQGKVNLLMNLLIRRAEAVAAAELTFEGGNCYIRGLARLRLDADVGV